MLRLRSAQVSLILKNDFVKMKKKYIYTIISIIVFYLIISGNDCGEHGPSYNGKIQFVQTDENLISQNGGYFAVALYGSSNALYNERPIYYVSVKPVKSGDKYSADFSFSSLAVNSYYAAVVWIKSPYNAMDQKPVLGTYGCDIDINCQSFKQLNSSPVNFSAYGDTSKHVFYNIPRQ